MAELTLQQWRGLAAAKLEAQRARAGRFQRYYDGEHDIVALMTNADRQTFREFLRESRANWCELVVNAVAERLQVTNFRFGNDEANQRAVEIWQASNMDSAGQLVQIDALVASSSYVLVQPAEDNPTGVELTGESPFEATVIYQPGSSRRRAAGFKRYPGGPAGMAGEVEVLILPDVIATWWPGMGEEPDVAVNPTTRVRPGGFVQLVEMRPQPRTLGPGRSELHSAVSFQDRINTTIFNRMVATDYGAFRQIWATGVKLAREAVLDAEGKPKLGADGKPLQSLVKPFNVGADRLLANENPDARFGEFAESTLAGYINAVAQDVQHLAAVTQTPPHYLLGQMVNLSADAIKAAETGLVAKVAQRAMYIGEAWEEAMRIALGFVGDPAADYVSAEVVWKDFETRSEGQLVDALVKLRGIGLPLEMVWERLGMTPTEIARASQLAATEATTAAVTQAAALGAVDPYAQLLTGGGPGPA